MVISGQSLFSSSRNGEETCGQEEVATVLKKFLSPKKQHSHSKPLDAMI